LPIDGERCSGVAATFRDWLAMRLTRRDRRRTLGAALLAYGLAGLLVLAVAAVVIGSAVDQLAFAGGRIEDQRQALLTTLRSTSATMRDASTGLGRVGGSLDAARTSADHAAALARSLGGTLHDLGAAMHIQILGTQPLAGLAAGFDTAASQSDQLAGDLADVTSALARNSSDLETSRRDLATLGDRVDLLAASVEIAPFGAGQQPVIVELVFLGLLLWLALPAAASIAVGTALIRTGRASGEPSGGLG
jgi:hypothetical protein